MSHAPRAVSIHPKVPGKSCGHGARGTGHVRSQFECVFERMFERVFECVFERVFSMFERVFSMFERVFSILSDPAAR
jgi:hypothetical protein